MSNGQHNQKLLENEVNGLLILAHALGVSLPCIRSPCLNALKREKCKIDHITRAKNRTKKIIYAKNDCQIYSNLTCKFCQFWKIYFLRILLELLDAKNSKTRYDFFSTSLFQHIAYLLCKDDHFWGGGGLHIRSWETTKWSYLKN